MNLATAIKIYATAAGTQVTDKGQGDAWIKDYLQKKQDKLDKMRRLVTPFPEDKKGIKAAIKEIGHWSPAPADAEQILKKSYKSGMKKARTVPRASLHTAPGAVPMQDVTGGGPGSGRHREGGGKEDFRSGHCHSFALALHQLTGWPIFGLKRKQDSYPGEHLIVESPRGAVDVDGLRAIPRWAKQHGAASLVPVTAEEIEKGLPGYMKAFPDKAMAYAKEVKDSIKERRV